MLHNEATPLEVILSYSPFDEEESEAAVDYFLNIYSRKNEIEDWGIIEAIVVRDFSEALSESFLKSVSDFSYEKLHFFMERKNLIDIHKTMIINPQSDLINLMEYFHEKLLLLSGNIITYKTLTNCLTTLNLLIKNDFRLHGDQLTYFDKLNKTLIGRIKKIECNDQISQDIHKLADELLQNIDKMTRYIHRQIDAKKNSLDKMFFVEGCYVDWIVKNYIREAGKNHYLHLLWGENHKYNLALREEIINILGNKLEKQSDIKTIRQNLQYADFSDLQEMQSGWISNGCPLKLQHTNFSGSKFRAVDFSEGDFSYVNFSNCTFKDCVFEDVIANYTNFSHCIFINCSFKDINSVYANFTGAILDGTDFASFPLNNVNLTNTSLLNVTGLSNRNLLSASHLQGIKLGTALNEEKYNYEFKCADLSNKNLPGLQMISCSFAATNFTSSNIPNVNFMYSNVGICDFTDGNLSHSNLSFCIVSHCTFTKTNLSNVNLTGTEMPNCIFKDAIVDNTDCSHLLLHPIQQDHLDNAIDASIQRSKNKLDNTILLWLAFLLDTKSSIHSFGNKDILMFLIPLYMTPNIHHVRYLHLNRIQKVLNNSCFCKEHFGKEEFLIKMQESSIDAAVGYNAKWHKIYSLAEEYLKMHKYQFSLHKPATHLVFKEFCKAIKKENIRNFMKKYEDKLISGKSFRITQ
jgi:fluoroquinolone resistance protein